MNAIEVEKLYKRYRLGAIGSGTLKDDLILKWAKIRGKDLNEYYKIGDNNRNSNENIEYVWALQNISFNVKKGEVLGIIGKNGAGKSTLLKILSKVTAPTEGEIRVDGRIASLLEVGTGFHPELTGKENIFLNGAILGMSKTEIRSKIDEIIDFSGIGTYINTPVKRYSSGMYVRLAFAVAAHLEPEILIVDEVLAVGDAEFQKKCLGKMKAVAGEGRTILFVSHNLDAVRTLCDRVLLIKDGKAECIGPTDEIIDRYSDFLMEKEEDNLYAEFSPESFQSKTDKFTPKTIELVPSTTADKIGSYSSKTEFELKLQFKTETSSKVILRAYLYNSSSICVFTKESNPIELTPGESTFSFNIPPNLLKENRYKIDVLIYDEKKFPILHINEYIYFTIKDNQTDFYSEKAPGIISIVNQWVIKS